MFINNDYNDQKKDKLSNWRKKGKMSPLGTFFAQFFELES